MLDAHPAPAAPARPPAAAVPAPSTPAPIAPRPALPSKPSALLAAARTLLPVLETGRPLDARVLREAMTRAFGASDAEGAWVWKDAYEAAEAALVLFLQRYGRAMRREAGAGSGATERPLRLEHLGGTSASVPGHDGRPVGSLRLERQYRDRRHRGGSWARNTQRNAMEGLEYFAGVDWGSETHQVCIVDGDLDSFVGGEAVTGQRDQAAPLALEGLAHADGVVFGPGPLCGDALAPGLSLGVEIVDIAPRAGGEEAVANIADVRPHAPVAEIQNPRPTQLPAERNRAVRPRAVNLEAVLRQINPDHARLFHGCPFPLLAMTTLPTWQFAMPLEGGVHSIA